ncbi:MAG: formylglycine-generating enzyme family protein [Deltaproteobacteria bacterium]
MALAPAELERLVLLLDDPSQAAPLAERLQAALALGEWDPRPSRPPLQVPAGSFARGSLEPAGNWHEWPRRAVALSAFAIDRYPTTVAQFARFVDDGGYRRPELWDEAGRALLATGVISPRFSREADWGGADWSGYLTPNRPIVGVSHLEATAYARWAGRRLPTEAEWERAARGEAGREYPWGDPFDGDRCHSRGGHRGTLPVGCFPAGRSPIGALDMAGNVWEWCQDWFDPRYYAVAPQRDPPGPERGDLRVARGGGWNAMPPQLRCANRNAWPPEARYSNLGFRLAG